MADQAEMDMAALAQSMSDAVLANRQAAIAQEDAAGARIGRLRAAFRSGTLGDLLSQEVGDLKKIVKVTDGNSDGSGPDPSGASSTASATASGTDATDIGAGSARPDGTGSRHPQPSGPVHPQGAQAGDGVAAGASGNVPA